MTAFMWCCIFCPNMVEILGRSKMNLNSNPCSFRLAYVCNNCCLNFTNMQYLDHSFDYTIFASLLLNNPVFIANNPTAIVNTAASATTAQSARFVFAACDFAA